MSPKSGSTLSRAARYAVPFALIPILIWRAQVNTQVPEPYLDEVFHVPQAQAYWAHKWTQWDPKLTTPPGLYLWSYLLCAILLAIRGSPTQLDTEALRTTNTATSAVFLPWRLQALSDSIHKVANKRPLGAWLSHTVLNICLFPPLCFFSGLYYTDVLSLLVVVEAYNWHLKRSSEKGYAVLKLLGFLVFGLAALVCRQTNIFWVAIFLGGLQVVSQFGHTSKYSESLDFLTIVKRGLRGEVFDPYVSEAYLEASLRNPVSTVVSVIPHVIILGAFGTFVLWNNGVVLGHKEFHIAGVHLAQMLYIWPYFAFFSWPLLVIPLINTLAPQKPALPKYLNYGLPKSQKKLPRALTLLLIIPVMLAIVHFNTIVHPFTLADNRHYVFYVFRLLLGVHPMVKYVAVPVYFLCGWAVMLALGFSFIRPRFLQLVEPAPKPKAKPASPAKAGKEQVNKSKPTSKKSKEKPQPQPSGPDPAIFAQVKGHLIARARHEPDAPHASFVLVWFVATALSLVTAPLVEPRYFIIPWVMWRLHLPPAPTLAAYKQKRPEIEDEKVRADLATNLPKFVETVWFLIINAGTGYVFLYKGFEWPQEPGKIQRFMW
ncbi:Dol-P-Glc:Glc(2)Man(9)GlcNAc(2)-PP-Dol alpha-1-2-glucosyltransferase [Penicillium capsulatum]|uniref:Dol-P-Glc:Glc(2)Man(9)GlcNAc(2)-PP-Dol alpha-1,2-glucosyltransferase n=1 Tax=Penicillium capsulatum TaxID=69766 RepID=A0A9W9IBC3_9EURO|nr:Dol-P-Glc:Glc(2)Man(9)GlcNAc(2)-PP-Dol alpha-1-2-glucosyltransferase [Penicillium capsulatum]